MLDEVGMSLNDKRARYLTSLLRSSKDTFMATQSPRELDSREDIAQFSAAEKQSNTCGFSTVLFRLSAMDVHFVAKANGLGDVSEFNSLMEMLRPERGKESEFLFNDTLASLPLEQLQFNH
jgi:hypothetical protein